MPNDAELMIDFAKDLGLAILALLAIWYVIVTIWATYNVLKRWNNEDES